MVNWIKYAQWEESQQEVQRARSVYERALDVDHRTITVWLKYAEMEMRLECLFCTCSVILVYL